MLALSLSVAACAPRPDTASDSAGATTNASAVPYAYDRVALDTLRAPGAIIDSVFPMPEMLRRFREGLPETPALLHTASTRDALVRSFVAALASSDRSALGQLALSRAEFAYVYFPHVSDTSSDASLPPQREWDQLTLRSEKGIGRAMARLGGAGLALQSLACPSAPVVRGELTLHQGCTVRIGRSDSTLFSGHLFGTIVEQAGRYKFAGYSNDM